MKKFKSIACPFLLDKVIAEAGELRVVDANALSKVIETRAPFLRLLTNARQNRHKVLEDQL